LNIPEFQILPENEKVFLRRVLYRKSFVKSGKIWNSGISLILLYDFKNILKEEIKENIIDKLFKD
jgi:hypothetical protein